MSSIKFLRRFHISDSMVVRDVYYDAIRTQCDSLYTQEQIDAWSSLALLPGVLDCSLSEGFGWVSCVEDKVVAFAIRYPLNHLALLYCRGNFSREGHGKALLDRIELDANLDKQEKIFTEASLLSYKLLLRSGWHILKPQKIRIAGVTFERFLMAKRLNSN